MISSNLTIRPATPAQAATLYELKQAIWPGERATVEQVEAGLSAPDQLTVVGWQGNVVVGFAAAFPTMTATGQRRWELDLLGVHPAARGQRLGTKLIETMLRQLPRQADEPMRALIATSNIASQTAFRRAGFHQEQMELGLFSSELRPAGQTNPTTIPAHLIPVQTLNYGGYWLEAIADGSALSLAAGLPSGPTAALVGALLPLDRQDLHTTARHSGYAHIGNYHWWHKTN